mmetsp:Transcript_2194/g.5478  ORF Transcript_2194/g.5478 Transcript_2194/m.5478 type:complete len:225 (+) Transcript_2194:296-970(+)|eukprot:jgi/Tetstr1/443416/TSEL_031427.t1
MAETSSVEGKMDAAPPVIGIPISTPAAADGGEVEAASGARGKLSALAGRAKELGAHVVSQMKPWSEMVDREALSKPESVSEALGRLRKNVAYFKFNYLTLSFLVTALTFISHPGSLVWLAALATMWFYLYIVRKEPLTVSGRTLSAREQLLACVGVSVLVVFFLTSVGSELIYALVVSSAIIAAHGAFRAPDELFLDDVESSSFLPQSTAVSLQNAMAQVTASA